MTLGELNALSRAAFVAAVGGVFEHSPWVAERAWPARPFASADALHQSMVQVVLGGTGDEQLALVRAHPELAGREAQAGSLTVDSSGEQGRLGFTALSTDEFQKMAQMNRSYREKFGFPCIVALRLHASRGSVMAEMERRLANDAATELSNALEQIGHISRGRLDRILEEK
jgi:chitin deacetylase